MKIDEDRDIQTEGEREERKRLTHRKIGVILERRKEDTGNSGEREREREREVLWGEKET